MKTLIKNATILSHDFKIIKNVYLLIENKTIRKITKLKPEYKIDVVYDAEGFILIPSFINAHIHLGESAYIDLVSINNLNKYIACTEDLAKHITKEEYAIISKYSLFEALKQGTGGISCARNWSESNKFPIIGLFGYPIMKSNKLKKFSDNFLEKFPKYLMKNNKRKQTGLWIHSLNYVDKNNISEIKKCAESYDYYTSIHLAENKETVKETFNKYGKTEIDFLDRNNLLNNKINLVHCTKINDDDINLIKKNGAHITICPISSANLKNGKAPVKKILNANINLSIATDGLATGKTFSLLENVDVFINTYANFNISSKDIFNMITLNPAKAIGLKNTGALKEGNYADINFFKNNQYNDFEELFKDLIKQKRPKKLMISGKFVFDSKNLKNKYEQRFNEIKIKLKNIKKVIEYNKKLLKSEKGNIVSLNEKCFAQIKLALCFPAEYKYAIETHGYQLLYYLLNKEKHFFCQRAYYPDLKILNKHKHNKIPILTQEKNETFSEQDFVLFSFNYEGNYANFFEMMDLSKINALRIKRTEDDPIMICGGITPTYNPEPLSPFFDIIIIGEAENNLLNIIHEYRKMKNKDNYSKINFLKKIKNIRGVYVPIEKTKVKPFRLKKLSSASQESMIISSKSAHPNYLNLEITRGCMFNCDFCVLKKVFGNSKHNESEKILGLTNNMSKYTNKIRFITPSDTYHPNIKNIYHKLTDQGYVGFVGSQRADLLNEDFFEYIKKLKINNLTLAPETGNETLRYKINKKIEDKYFFKAVDLAAKNKIKKLSLFFIIGFPEETEKDYQDIVYFIESCKKIYAQHNLTDFQINVTINALIIKPHTKYELESQIHPEKYFEITKRIKHKLNKCEHVKINLMDEYLLYLEVILVRGTKSEGLKLYKLYKKTKNTLIDKNLLKIEFLNKKNYFKKINSRSASWKFIQL